MVSQTLNQEPGSSWPRTGLLAHTRRQVLCRASGKHTVFLGQTGREQTNGTMQFISSSLRHQAEARGRDCSEEAKEWGWKLFWDDCSSGGTSLARGQTKPSESRISEWPRHENPWQDLGSSGRLAGTGSKGKIFRNEMRGMDHTVPSLRAHGRESELYASGWVVFIIQGTKSDLDL